MKLLDVFRRKRRFGLLLRAVNRRVARAGIRINPYLLYLESSAGARTNDGPGSTYYSTAIIREENHGPILDGLPEGAAKRAVWRRRIAAGNPGLVLLNEEKIVGYMWASLTVCRGVAVKPLFILKDNQAYLFDTYVVETYRGKGVSGLLRRLMYEELAARGRTEYYSISMYFNRPARVFKEKLGARRVEARLSIDLFGKWLADYRLRSFVPDLPTPWRAISREADPTAVT